MLTVSRRKGEGLQIWEGSDPREGILVHLERTDQPNQADLYITLSPRRYKRKTLRRRQSLTIIHDRSGAQPAWWIAEDVQSAHATRGAPPRPLASALVFLTLQATGVEPKLGVLAPASYRIRRIDCLRHPELEPPPVLPQPVLPPPDRAA